jgi:hypothetical protein
MFVDPNQINPYDKILGGPKMNDDDFNGIKSTWILLRSVIRKQKIEKIYGTKSEDRKENF